ncbi:MAG: helix-turn-helix domain-containing protein [Paracoccaceae bacterium]
MRPNNFLTLKQACDLLQVHPQTIYNWRKNEDFPPPIRIGSRKLLWLESDLLDWLDIKNSSSPAMEERNG